MGKKRRRREATVPSLPSLTVIRLPISTVSLVPVTTPKNLTEVEDRRTFHPLGPTRPARFSTGGPSSLTLRDKPKAGRFKTPFGHSQTKATVAFDDPGNVLVCLRRKRRKEVLHAMKRAGKGGRQRRHRRNTHSAIRC